MASSRERQRTLAREKMKRQSVRRALRARRNRQIRAGVVAGTAVLAVIVLALWAGGVFSGSSSKKSPTPPVAANECTWAKADTSANKNLKDVGTPPTSGLPKAGSETMTITTNLGVIKADLNLGQAPCTAASFKFLGSKGFFDNTKCHRLLDKGDYVLQCGDPSATGSGGPGYTFADEYLPTAANGASTALYPAGTIAMANSGPNTNGSQFFIVYGDSQFPPSYTMFGKVTSGLDIVKSVGAAGDDGNGNGDGHPKKAVTIKSLTVGDLAGAASPATSAAASAAPSTPASAGASSSAAAGTSSASPHA